MMAAQRIVFGGRIEVAKPRMPAPKPEKPLPLFEAPPIAAALPEEETPSPRSASDPATPDRADLSSPARDEEAPAATPARGEDLAAITAERDALIGQMEPLGRYSYRRRRLEEQLAAITTKLLALEIGR